jgi:hypothetical protein
MDAPSDVATLRELVTSEGADLATFDIVVSGFMGDDPSPWAAVGVSWFLNWIGPYELNYDEVRAMIADGPRTVNA